MPVKKNKKRSFFDDDFDFFSDFEDEFEKIYESFMKHSSVFDQLKKMPPGEGNPLVYGFSMKIGPEGKPEIRQFGNVPKMIKEKEVTDEREPLIDIIDRDTQICVMAELPGVDKNDIDLSINEDKLTIDVKNPARKYNKTITLPANVDSKNIKANYKNGVLEVTLCKIKSKEKGRKIKID